MGSQVHQRDLRLLFLPLVVGVAAVLACIHGLVAFKALTTAALASHAVLTPVLAAAVGTLHGVGTLLLQDW